MLHQMFRHLNTTFIILFTFRQEALRQAERERRKKYKAQNDEREVVRSAIREKVGTACY